MMHKRLCTVSGLLLLLAGCTPATGDSGDSGDSPVDSADPGDTGDSGAPEDRMRVFVTSGSFLGTLYVAGGGVEAGDEQCGNAATAAALGGTWKAWLSTSTIDAVDRFDDVGPWFLVDRQTVVFSSSAQLADGPSAPIDQTEYGESPANSAVWTGTAAGGTRASDTCLDWTSGGGAMGVAGDATSGGGAWTNASTEGCGVYAAVYCLEQ